jgi:hypothetical protein
MLSIPVICELTGAVPLLVYRHPGAALTSYRRMGWQPDLAELRPILREHRRTHATEDQGLPELPLPGETDEATAMALFWSALYEIALDRAAGVEDLVVVSHEELAGGGMPAVEALFKALRLSVSSETAAEIEHEQPPTQPERPVDGNATGQRPALHDFDRSPEQAAHSWRAKLPADEIATMETVAADMLGRLDELRVRLDA